MQDYWGDSKRSLGKIQPLEAVVLGCMVFLVQGCSSSVAPLPADTFTTKDSAAPTDLSDTSQVSTDTSGTPDRGVLVPIEVHVSLDDAPAPGTTVSQGGNPERWTTNAEGVVTVTLNLTVPGELVLIASHPEARIRGRLVSPDHTGPFELSLKRFETQDNPDYAFKDPGEPGMSHVIEKCGHCHLTIDDTWFSSAHKTSASNPVLHDIYQGTASGFTDQEACQLAGGNWKLTVKPGTGEDVMACVVAEAVTDSGAFGGCADCHAPGIDGQLGGRDLLEARDHAFNYGVHCDVCHHTESVDMEALPGVAGRLKIVRPSEPAFITGLGEFQPLTFCPNDDVPNIYMGCVQRDHFRSSEFCGACHEQRQPALLPETSVDTDRWPDGTIPIHTTFSEWQSSAFGNGVTCQSCHMPPAPPEIVNGADLQAFDAASTGITGGWPRPPGATKLHTWSGPRSPEAYQLPVPVTIQVEKAIAGDMLTADVTVTNTGAGHSVPTGDPLRSVLVVVSASCADTDLLPAGGDAVPDYGGSTQTRPKSEDWTTWTDAKLGDRIRVIKRGEPVDYSGYGAFGDGTFSVEERGILRETVVGSRTITGIEDGTVTLDGPLPEGDVAYLIGSENAYAGLPGAGFARVLTDSQGNRMVPHFKAVDAASDNRIASQGSRTSRHLFKASCDEPSVHVRLIHRAYPLSVAKRRGWPLRDTLWVQESY